MDRLLAFDLGAESGRALLGGFDRDRLSLTEVHRFPNTPLRLADSLRWDVHAIWRNVQQALASTADLPLVSIGVDAWGCDYALLDDRGDLVELPYHYRDHRTDRVMDRVTDRIGRNRIYETTGVQFLPFNTLFQLSAAAETEPSVLPRAAALLTIPDYVNFRLTGHITCEYTNATTTQCVDARSRTWATPLLDELALPSRLFGSIVEPGTVLGPLVQADRGGLVAVVAPACHDTGSAVAAVDATGDVAFLSSGTWSLLGVEMDRPVINDRGRALNFTNEGGVMGTTRLLKNIAGLWLLQACRRDWALEGHSLSYETLAAAAAQAPAFGPVVDPDDASFLNPAHMPSAIDAFCRVTKQPVPDGHAGYARTVFESLALKYRLVLEQLETLSGRSLRTIRVIGGGARNRLLNQLTSDVTGRVVVAGPVEATALGNLALQLLATARVSSLAEARVIIDRSFPAERFFPLNTDRWELPYRRFRDYVELACA